MDDLVVSIPESYEEQCLRLHRREYNVQVGKDMLRNAAAEDRGPVRNQVAASWASSFLTQMRFDRDWFVHSHHGHSRFEWARVHHYDLQIIRWCRALNEIIVNDLKVAPIV